MPHIKLDDKKIITTMYYKGGRLRFGLSKGNEDEKETKEGDHIKCGRIPCFENTNHKSAARHRAKRFNEELKKTFDRYAKLNAMGIAATYNRLHAPLREYREKR